MSSATFKVGILCCGVLELLDAGAVDLLGLITKDFPTHISAPKALIEKAPNFEFKYILNVTKGNGELPDYTLTSSSGKFKITDTLDTAGDLDFLIIAGPPLNYEHSADITAFIQHQFKVARNVLTICTGCLPLALSGVLEGRHVTGPLPIITKLREVAPEAEWLEERWEVDAEGKVWTSGAFTNGMDMMLAFIRKTFGDDLAQVAVNVADITERSREYPKEQFTRGTWF